MAIQSVFSQDDNSTVDVKRNAFDLSFQNNLTMNFGKLYPVFCKEVVPGDGFKIDAQFALNLLPMVFPVQTKLQARLDFYYCRNRALWRDWKDFVYHTKEGLQLPYLGFNNEQQRKLLTSSSLGDYFNLPTQSLTNDIVGQYLFNRTSEKFQTGYSGPYALESSTIPSFDKSRMPVRIDDFALTEGDVTAFADFLDSYPTTSNNALQVIAGVLDLGAGVNLQFSDVVERINRINLYDMRGRHSGDVGSNVAINYDSSASPVQNRTVLPYWFFPFNESVDTYPYHRFQATFRIPKDLFTTDSTGEMPLPSIDSVVVRSDGSLVHTGERTYAIDNGDSYYYFTPKYVLPADDWTSIVAIGGVMTRFAVDNPDSEFGWKCYQRPNEFLLNDMLHRLYVYTHFGFTFSFLEAVYISAIPDVANYAPPQFAFETNMASSPFLSGNVKVSALPFRAYEAIYNCWYRNEKVMPFTVDGQVEYNVFNTNLNGGEDNTPYDFYYHNWEKDFLTTALPSPQQGEAPLVGVRVTENDTFEIIVNGVVSHVTPTVSEDGRITGVSLMNDGENFPEGALEILQNRIRQGFSINDLRSVNAFQEWLETNLRRGYKYRDLIYAHTGERIHFNELDMPEYLGGVSDLINVNKIVNTNGDGSTPLGEFAGLASLYSGLKNGIDVHCDEHGFVIGIMSVVPVPVYTQLLPKHFLKFHELDFYNKEFQRIGMQPIYYDEVAPNERFNEDPNSLSDVFGYQRAYYDYMSSQDEAHGLFRSNLRNYVLGRYFSGSPELGADFIVTSPDQLNNIFPTSYGEGDKILGQIYFDVVAQRPMMRNAIPSL